ncbi:hypothetical protein ASPBRDRAFT_672166 [Aspergillus brasiliensis CBS 101740]|uniref:Uncharacterized protein n=1 Tax=Aspergillus brasiliensis (strain CBS 101740 / IMI 381727 / IBT 21946) TaxID=767769 RepID=A0A1L9UKU2_ASPBC|nr:hypothetical protein ASPBRDRAFT_672166 [Aspergillus brasiliensis CBS 101740]
MSVSETTKHRRELLHVPTQAPRQSIAIQASAAVNQETNDTGVLSRSAVPSVKFHILSRFLQDNESVFNQRGFCFAGQPIHQPHFTLFCHRTPTGTIKEDGPFLGYLDYLDVTGMRARKLAPSGIPTHSQNAIGARIFAKKLSRVTPEEWTEDPYFICVLLSIAQLQRRLSTDRSTRAFSPRLLVVSRHDREFVHLYEAQITVEFLEMLDKLTAVPASTNGPIIYQRNIPFRPFETFPARVRAETLASAIVDTISIPENGAVK